MIKQILALILLSLSVSVNAATYSLTDVTFNDGGYAEGSFDAEVGTGGIIALISYDVTTYEQNGTVRNVYQNVGGSAQNGIRIWDVTGNNLLLWWDGAQLDPGVTQTLAIDTTSLNINGTGVSCEQVVGGQFCEVPTLNQRWVVTGSINLVPIPAAAWLFGSALLGLGVIKRKKV